MSLYKVKLIKTKDGKIIAKPIEAVPTEAIPLEEDIYPEVGVWGEERRLKKIFIPRLREQEELRRRARLKKYAKETSKVVRAAEEGVLVTRDAFSQSYTWYFRRPYSEMAGKSSVLFFNESGDPSGFKSNVLEPFIRQEAILIGMKIGIEPATLEDKNDTYGYGSAFTALYQSAVQLYINKDSIKTFSFQELAPSIDKDIAINTAATPPEKFSTYSLRERPNDVWKYFGDELKESFIKVHYRDQVYVVVESKNAFPPLGQNAVDFNVVLYLKVRAPKRVVGA